MSTIEFELSRWNGEILVLEVASPKGVEQLKFKFMQPVSLHEDNLAVALSTLCGTGFDQIEFGFPISERVRGGIAEWTRSKVLADASSEPTVNQHREKSAVLNFSGGLDSLAASFILGDETTLVSLDFGGRFAREEKFFRNFDTHVVQTNLTNTSLRYNSWSFMGIGPLLLAGEIRDRFFAFGSILEAGQLKRGHAVASSQTFPPFALCGYDSVMPVGGISEAGTIAIVQAHRPDLLSKSLQSLASPGEEKYFRKIALARAVTEILGVDSDLPDLPLNQRVHYDFGQNFAVDLTALFFIAFGFKSFAESIVRTVPSSIASAVNESNMAFMLKFDQAYYANYPKSLERNRSEALKVSGLSCYESADYAAVDEIRRLMGKFYNF